MSIKKREETGQQAPHEPDEKSRATVKMAAGLGLPQKMICTLLGIGSTNTLVKHYADELAKGEAEATLQVASTLFHRATVGKDLGAAVFWLKARAGWREKHVLDDPDHKTSFLELVLAAMQQKPAELPGELPAPAPRVTRQ